MNATYFFFEIKRLFRNRQNVIFSLIFPIVLFFAIAAPNKNVDIIDNIPFPRYYFAGMIGFGTLAAVLAGGARISLEREVGWNRQLRLTPLSPREYIRTKIITSYLVAILSILVVSAAAISLGVRFPIAQWLHIVGLVLVALIPFAALGILIGHLIKGDAMGPVMGGSISLFSIVGGGYFPIGTGDGFMHYFVRAIPSFWLVQAGKTGIGGQAWTPWSWIVIAVWSVVLGAAAAWAYRRDTQRA